MRLDLIAEPCHNFSIMSRIIIASDPLDGREKMVMGNYAADNAGSLHIVDTHTLKGESYLFPDDAGAWALCYLKERGELLIGTCDHLGCLHCFDMKTRTFVGTLRVPSEAYLWRFARGADGCVYAGTYPGCRLLRYDPEKRALDDLGLVGDSAENHYSTPLFATDDGNIVVCAAHARPKVFLYDVRAKAFKQVGQNGDMLTEAKDGFICVKRGGHLIFFDQKTLAKIDGPFDEKDKDAYLRAAAPSVRGYLDWLMHPKKLPDLPLGIRGERTADGHIVGPIGQEVYRVEGETTRFRRTPGEPPATSIMTIVGVGNVLWGSCENGQTIFSYDPETDKYWNSNCVCSNGGEVYGMVETDGRLYMTAYAGGDHVVYDPHKPWDQRGNVNPRTLESAGPRMIRPNARSVRGRNGDIYTGWYAAYGVYGGGMSRIDPRTDEVRVWFGLVPQQSIEHIAAGPKGIYAVTGGCANGLEMLVCAPHLVRLNDDCGILADRCFKKGLFLSRVAVYEYSVYAASFDPETKESLLEIFDAETLQKTGEIALGKEDGRVTDVLMLDDRMLLFMHAKAAVVSLPDGEILSSCAIPGEVYTSARLQNGAVYCTCRRGLYHVAL